MRLTQIHARFEEASYPAARHDFDEQADARFAEQA